MSIAQTDFVKNIVLCRPEEYVSMPFLSESDGETQMNVNGSVTPVRYAARVPGVDTSCVISRITLVLEDNVAMPPEKFGGITALTNGINIFWEDDKGDPGKDIVIFRVKTNADFALFTNHGFNAITRSPGASAPDAFSVCIGFDSAGLRLLIHPGERIIITINDDLTAIAGFRAMAHGYLKNR